MPENSDEMNWKRYGHIVLLLLLVILSSVSNSYGCSPPIADFNVDNTTPVVGETVVVTDNSSANSTSWSWNFGTDAVPPLANSKGPHNIYYSSTGTKTISLKVSNFYGSDNKTTNITVYPKPTASISGSTTICFGQSTNLLVALTGTQPWSITYTDGTTPVTINNISSSPHTESVSPTTTTTYTLIDVNDYYGSGDVSGSAIITVDPTSVGGTATVADPTICPNSNTTISLAGFSGSIQWQQSADGSSGWANVTGGSGATTDNYTTANLSVTTYYRAEVISGTCAANYSDTVVVTVEDTEDPVITFNDPLDDLIIAITNSTSATTVSVDFTNFDDGSGARNINPTATDNCSYTLTNNKTSTDDATGSYNLGETILTWTAVDAASNTDTKEQKVYAARSNQFVLTCPPDEDLGCNPSTFPITAPTYSLPTWLDNLIGNGTLTVDTTLATTLNAASGTECAVTRTRIYTVTFNIKYNGTTIATVSRECTQTYSYIIDTEDPVISCTTNKSVDTDAGECNYTHSGTAWNATATDNCATPPTIEYVLSGVTTGTGSSLAGIVFNIGVTTVNWTATDNCTNSDNCSYTVTVTDNEDPTITCPADVTVNPDDENAGICTASGVDLGTPTTSDNCPGETTSNNAPATFPIGNTTVIWIVTDAAGNTATCNQTVTVQPAVIIDIEVEDLGNMCQSGETGSTTTITWDITKVQGSNNWTYDYTINDGSTNVQTGTNVSASGNIQISYTMDNATATDKIYTITLTNVKDNCGVAETNTGNNSDAATLFGVPATGDIIPD